MLDRSQADIADAADIPRSSFGRYCHGERSMTLGQVEAALEALSTTWEKAMPHIQRLRTLLEESGDE